MKPDSAVTKNHSLHSLSKVGPFPLLSKGTQHSLQDVCTGFVLRGTTMNLEDLLVLFLQENGS